MWVCSSPHCPQMMASVPCTTRRVSWPAFVPGLMWSCLLERARLLHLEGVFLREVGTLRASIGVRSVWVQSAGIGSILNSPGTWHFVWVCDSPTQWVCVCVCVCVCMYMGAIVRGKSGCFWKWWRVWFSMCGCFPKCVCAVYMRVHVCMFDRERRREREKRKISLLDREY